MRQPARLAKSFASLSSGPPPKWGLEPSRGNPGWASVLRGASAMQSPAVIAAAQAIHRAHGMLVAAGAGMGVDSGLPDFRGSEGFWRAYPPFRALGLGFEDLANPRWFDDDPELAWGFYGHRLRLYRATAPHAGFSMLLRWASTLPAGLFVFTSNVDGQFQRAGFPEDRIYEVHGSLLHSQCTRSCGAGIFSAGSDVSVDEATMRARPPLPTCPACGALARPNVLMFGDWHWDGSRAAEQDARLQSWLQSVEGPLVVIECGAGSAVPTVRETCEALASRPGDTLVRVNPREHEVPSGHLALAATALAGLAAIDAALTRL